MATDLSHGGSSAHATDVLIAGGGPCGLMLANELGRRGIRSLVVDAKPERLRSASASWAPPSLSIEVLSCQSRR